jgi:hypothetical protein
MSVPFTSESAPASTPPAGLATQATPRGPEFVIPPPHQPAAVAKTSPPAAPPMWNTFFAVSLATLASVYALASLVKAYLLDADAATLTKIMNDPASVTIEQIHTLANLERQTDTPYLTLLYLTFIAYVVWMLTLNSRLKALGRRDALRGLTAIRMWQAGVAISFVTLWLARSPAPGSPPSDFVAADHRAMVYMLIRAAVGALCVWVAISLRAKTNPVLAGASTRP